jgi:hypothetical protein
MDLLCGRLCNYWDLIDEEKKTVDCLIKPVFKELAGVDLEGIDFSIKPSVNESEINKPYKEFKLQADAIEYLFIVQGSKVVYIGKADYCSGGCILKSLPIQVKKGYILTYEKSAVMLNGKPITITNLYDGNLDYYTPFLGADSRTSTIARFPEYDVGDMLAVISCSYNSGMNIGSGYIDIKNSALYMWSIDNFDYSGNKALRFTEDKKAVEVYEISSFYGSRGLYGNPPEIVQEVEQLLDVQSNFNQLETWIRIRHLFNNCHFYQLFKEGIQELGSKDIIKAGWQFLNMLDFLDLPELGGLGEYDCMDDVGYMDDVRPSISRKSVCIFYMLIAYCKLGVEKNIDIILRLIDHSEGELFTSHKCIDAELKPIRKYIIQRYDKLIV